jgi:hypothetical protein
MRIAPSSESAVQDFILDDVLGQRGVSSGPETGGSGTCRGTRVSSWRLPSSAYRTDRARYHSDAQFRKSRVIGGPSVHRCLEANSSSADCPSNDATGRARIMTPRRRSHSVVLAMAFGSETDDIEGAEKISRRQYVELSNCAARLPRMFATRYAGAVNRHAKHRSW